MLLVTFLQKRGFFLKLVGFSFFMVNGPRNTKSIPFTRNGFLKMNLFMEIKISLTVRKRNLIQ